MTRADLQDLAELRLYEAQLLLRAGSWSGAYYLAGYAVECALKACIAKATQQFEFPDRNRATQSYTHKLKDLLKVAKLEQTLSDSGEQDAAFEVSWAIVTAWSEESRYRIWPREQAESLIAAISDTDHGVMSWLKTQW